MSNTLRDNLSQIGRAAKHADCQFVYYYPGMSADAVALAIDNQATPSLNERNAFEFAYGACLAGKRSAVVCKGVGLATCLDSVQHSVIAGVHAGLVIVLLEDTVGASSPEIVDSRLLADYAQLVVIEPATMEHAMQYMAQAFSLSEELDMPICIRLTYGVLQSMSDAAHTLPPVKPFTPKKIDYRTKVISAWSDRRHGYEQKLRAAQDYIDSIYSTPGQGTREIVFGYSATVGEDALQIEHYPVPTVVRLLYKEHQPNVYEIGSNYGLGKLQASTAVRVSNDQVVSGMLVPMDDWERALKHLPKDTYDIVVGDEGKYTFDTTEMIDFCLCMGSSIAVAAGISLALSKTQLAIIGDFAFQFNAYQAIVEAYHRQARLDIVVLDDGVAASTGSQKPVGTLRIADLDHYVQRSDVISYESIDDAYINRNEGGITVYHIQK